MSWIDWLIVILPIVFVVWIAFFSKRYVKGVVDYLAAGRVAGRYVISVGDLMAGLSVITLVANAEQYYQTGFGVAFWANITAPIGIVLALTGFCTYRWRETKCLSKGQFIELRYGSRSFRFITAFVSTMAEMVTNAIGPAIATNFFIYFLGLPHEVMICGINLPCYAIIVVMCLTLATLIIWPGGRVSLLVTDSIQGLMSYPIFVVIIGFVILKFSWNVDLAPILLDRVEGESFLNPYDIAKLRDFNVFALIVTLISSVINRASWIGNDTSNSGRTPHEQKMAGILGSFRNGFSMIMMILIGIITVVFMNSPEFAFNKDRFGVTNNEMRKILSERVAGEAIADPAVRSKVIETVRAIPDKAHDTHDRNILLSQNDNLDTRYLDIVRNELGDTPEGRHSFQKFRSLYNQMMMPTMMGKILPIGVMGLFCVLMVMLLVSTDDSRIFNAAGCIIQDMVLPFLKKPLDPKTHMVLLRWCTVGVSLFFLVVALFFSQLDYINMFTTIMCAFWLGGAGPIMVFGLYTRFGNLTGAWCALIFGSGTSLLGLIFQRNWALHIYPFLAEKGWVESLDNFLRTVSDPFNPWIQWQMDAVKFPINSYEIFFISMMLAIGSYIIGSFLTYKPYNLDRLLHRGAYSDGHVVERQKWTLRNVFAKLLSITPDYTRGDKIIAWSVFIYSFIYQLGLTFIVVVIWNAISPWPNEWWSHYYYIAYLLIPGIVGVISTVWFSVGGTIDIIRLFKDLAVRTVDTSDNGQVFQEIVDDDSDDKK